MTLCFENEVELSFYAAVMKFSGSDEGNPGPRYYRNVYHGAYCPDLDKNKRHEFLIKIMMDSMPTNEMFYLDS